MFLLVAIALVVLGGFFVAGMLSRLTKPRAVSFEPVQPPVKRPVDLDVPWVSDQNLIGIDGRPAGVSSGYSRRSKDASKSLPPSMGWWD